MTGSPLLIFFFFVKNFFFLFKDSLDKTVQKKSYKILNSILTGGKTVNPDDSKNVVNNFVKGNLNKITSTFVTTLTKCNSAAKPVCVLFLC